MEVVRHSSPQRFLDYAAQRFSGEAEARHNLLLGMIGTALRVPEAYPRIHMWTVEDDGQVVGTAAVTPPYDIILGEVDVPEAVETLTASVHAQLGRLPGAIGNVPEVEWFVHDWCSIARTEGERVMAQGVFSLDTISRQPAAPGDHRPATRQDRPLLLKWMRDFHREVHPPGSASEARIVRGVDMRLGTDPTSGFWLWENGGDPVAVSGYGGKTSNGIRIGPVYTPPEHREHGYATSLVAVQSEWLLATGYRFCFLYTDLANPTSNAIYRRIGYHQVAESAQYRFTAG